MVRILFVDVCRTVIAKDGEEEGEIGGESSLEAKDEEHKDEYIEEEGDCENAPFEGSRVPVEVEDIEVGFRR